MLIMHKKFGVLSLTVSEIFWVHNLKQEEASWDISNISTKVDFVVVYFNISRMTDFIIDLHANLTSHSLHVQDFTFLRSPGEKVVFFFCLGTGNRQTEVFNENEFSISVLFVKYTMLFIKLSRSVKEEQLNV